MLPVAGLFAAFFTLAGAMMSLDILANTWKIALLFFAIRMVGMISGAWIGSTIAGDPKHFRKTEINNNDLENELIEPKIIKNKIDDELIDIHENQRKAEKLLSNNQKHNNNIDEILKNISKI